jgi:hypothetical protein
MSTSANKPIEDIEASVPAATKWALDELLRQAHATMAAKAGGDLDIVLAGSARAGMAGETALEAFGEVIASTAAV